MMFAPTSAAPADRGRSAATPALPAVLGVAIWVVLVAVGTLGRLWQPGWNITPMAGIALAAGAVFPHPLVAASVPLVARRLADSVSAAEPEPPSRRSCDSLQAALAGWGTVGDKPTPDWAGYVAG